MMVPYRKNWFLNRIKIGLRWFHTGKIGFRTEPKLVWDGSKQEKLVFEQNENWSEMVPIRKNWFLNRKQIVWVGSKSEKLLQKQNNNWSELVPEHKKLV